MQVYFLIRLAKSSSLLFEVAVAIYTSGTTILEFIRLNVRKGIVLTPMVVKWFCFSWRKMQRFHWKTGEYKGMLQVRLPTLDFVNGYTTKWKNASSAWNTTYPLNEKTLSTTCVNNRAWLITIGHFVWLVLLEFVYKYLYCTFHWHTINQIKVI